MATRGFDFKWYDAFFLSMLAISIIFVAVHCQKYRLCAHPLHVWVVVDYTTMFVFRLLMFVDNALAAGMGLHDLSDNSRQQRHARFCGRLIVLATLGLLLYPFLFAWSVIGTLWFIRAKSCLPNNGEKLAFAIWLLFSYCALLGMICICIAKWLSRRVAHQLLAQQGNPISEFGVFIDLIQVPNWAFELANQEMGRMGQNAMAEHLRRHLSDLTRAQREARIHELPKFELTAVPTDCGECSICLQELHVGNEVRGLPCAHNFHVECIDKWLRLNVNCPRCRRPVFPSAVIQLDQLATENYLARLLMSRHERSEQAGSGNNVEAVSNSGL